MLSLNQASNRIALLIIFLVCFSFVKIPPAIADGYPCQISVATTRVNVGEWSTDSITITTKPNSFSYLGNYPKTCRTTINGGYFDEVTLNNNFDFGRTTTLRVISASFMNGIYLREGSNSVESCAVSNIETGDFCSTAVITGYRKIEVPGYVPPPANKTLPTAPGVNSINGKTLLCVKIGDGAKNCGPINSLTWNYDMCWAGGTNYKFQVWNKSKKKFTQIKNVKGKNSSECEKDYPKNVKFSVTEKDTKNKTYRVLFSGNSTNGFYEDKIKVTFE
jgi:hypothetical protein